ncbi:MAG: pre-peptidase C-terminal domain-containing protein, partial [Verrucomicrobiota bacterium]
MISTRFQLGSPKFQTSSRSRVLGACVVAVSLFWSGLLSHCLAGSVAYSYDSLQRLTRVTHTDGTTIDYVYDALGNRLMKTTTLPGAPSNQPPAAVTNPSIANGVTNVPTTATLSWSPAVDPNSGDSVVYFIYFGTSPTPPLVFSGWPTNWSPGHLRGLTTYYWQIVARDSHNAQTASPVWSFTTGNEPPVADFVASSPGGWAPLAVTFTDRSFDTDNAIVSWQWDFDNNGTVDSTNRNPTFTYTTPGDYTVRLTVRDEVGATTTAVKTNLLSILGNNIVDLAPLGLTIESATSYRHLVVRYAITNQGTVSISGKWQWADTFYVSTNAFLDASATQIAIFYENQSLPASAVYSRTNVVTIPDVAAPNYYLLLKADGQNQIGEISEGNNVWAVPMTNNLPDLAASNLQAFGEAVIGRTIQVTYAVTNRGVLPIVAEWYDGSFLSSNATWDAGDVRIGDAYVDLALGFGDGYLVTNNATLPKWPPGTYYLIARADANNWLVESNEANNAISVPITLTAPVLPVGVTTNGALAQAGEAEYWRITVGAGQHLVVHLDSESVADDNELYVRHGAVPTPTEYDAAGKVPDQADQYAEISSTLAGDYYVLVRCVVDQGWAFAYTLRADTDATLPALTLGTPVDGALPQAGDFATYRISVGAGQQLVVHLDSESVGDDNELYVRHGVVPTPTEYDAAGKVPDQADQYAEITSTLAGDYYVLVRCVADQGTAFAYTLRADTEATLPTLTLGTAIGEALPEEGDFDIYRLSVAAGQHLVVHLDSESVGDDNELYVRHGAVPTPTEYDGAGKVPDQANQYAEIPSTLAGDYYVLVRCVADQGTAFAYTLRADTDATLPALTLGTAIGEALPEEGDFDIYRLSVAAGQHPAVLILIAQAAWLRVVG